MSKALESGLNERMRRPDRAEWDGVRIGALLTVLILCALASWGARDNLNTDAVAYAQIARHYAAGNWGLAVSGYWGPLVSWLAVPGILIGLEPILALRLVVGLSGVLFWISCSGLLRSVGLSRPAVACGEFLAALIIPAWVAQTLSPDLLLSASLLWAMRILFLTPLELWTTQAWHAGVACGIAYWSKGIGGPLGAELMGVALFWRIIEHAGPDFRSVWRERSGRVVRSLAPGAACFLALALPWVLVLSLHYGHLTFSTSGRIAHAVVGPGSTDRYHPFARTFHTPEAGRITSWEDPSRMNYQYWSPFENGENAKHQLGLIQENLRTVVVLLGGFELTGLSLIGIAGSLLLFAQACRAGRAVVPGWGLAWLACGCLSAPYLLVYVKEVDQRYLFAAFPWVLAGCLGTVEWAAGVGQKPSTDGFSSHSLHRLGMAGVTLIFGLSALPPLWGALTGALDPASFLARDLKQRMERAQFRGAIAGSGLIAGGRTGVYLAYWMRSPWRGDELNPSPEAIVASGAAFYLVSSKSNLIPRLVLDPRFEDLSGRLFSSAEEAQNYPLRLFAVRSAAGPSLR